MPTVSVIIPVFNGAAFVDKAIRSVLTQTFQDFEIIVVDDGSTDNTAKVVKAIVDDRVHYVYQPNQGPATARNNGIQRARGEFVAFLDSDDRWLPSKLEMQLRRLSEVPEAGLVHCAALIVDVEGNAKGCHSARLEGQVLDTLLMGNQIATSSVMVPCWVFDRVGVFDQNIRGPEDWELWMRIAAALPVVAVRDTLVMYTFLPGGFGKKIDMLRDHCLYSLEKAFTSYAAHRIHLRREAIARVHFGMGIGFGTFGELREARQELFQAVCWHPFIPGVYWRLLLTFLGPTLNRQGRQIKDRLQGWRACRKTRSALSKSS